MEKDWLIEDFKTSKDYADLMEHYLVPTANELLEVFSQWIQREYYLDK